MGHLYYDELSGEALWEFDYVDGVLSGLVIHNDPDLALFPNIDPSTAYWSIEGDTDAGWAFWFVDGFQGLTYKDDRAYTWAVTDGDIAATAIPIPTAFWLFFSGLTSLAGFQLREHRFGGTAKIRARFGVMRDSGSEIRGQVLQ
jgi:hypothetical protein